MTAEQMTAEDKYKWLLVADYFRSMTSDQRTDLVAYARKLAGKDKPKTLQERMKKRT